MQHAEESRPSSDTFQERDRGCNAFSFERMRVNRSKSLAGYGDNAATPSSATNTSSGSNPTHRAVSADETISDFRKSADPNAGDTPYAVSYVSTTAAKAETLLYGAPSSSKNNPDLGDAPVIAYVANGKFTGVMAKVPQGAATPEGRYFTAVLNAQTGAVMDWGITDRQPDIEELGKVQSA